MKHRFLVPALAVWAALPESRHASAHGFAGDRFFPATIQTDDPFVADEGSLPTLTRNPTDGSGRQSYTVETDLSKRITPNVDVILQYEWNYFQPKGAPAHYGLGTLLTGTQYQLFIDGPHEAMGLVGLNVFWAHSGAVDLGGADDHTTLGPEFDVGKGFGDLPDWLPWLRPFAITGNFSVDLPTRVNSDGTLNQSAFNAGFAIEYSLDYLQHQVKDIGLAAPFDRLIPLVEITTATPLNRGVNMGAGFIQGAGFLTNAQGRATTGLIAPGVIWVGQYYQIGVEAIFPYGEGQGHGVGGLVQLHYYLDDLFPNSIGRPLFD